MAYSLENVKEVIYDFVQTNRADSKELINGTKDAISVNRVIFDIESFLVELRTTYKLNERLDTSIVSESILKNFNSIWPKDAFRPADYQLNFLHHLAVNFLPNKDLVTLIDDFIEIFKNQFTLADIVITQSGATRCKTNIRFGLNELRDLGFVLSKGEDDKRSWAPSTIGLVALLNIEFNRDVFKNKADYKEFGSLRTLRNDKPIEKYYTYDPTLVESIRIFKEDGHLYSFLDKLKYESKETDKAFFEAIIDLYIDFVDDGLEITEKGIRITKEFKEKSELFQKNLFAREEQNKGLHLRLLQYFRKEMEGNK
jgi:hypothetical protein